MGFLGRAIIVGAGGLAPIKAQSEPEPQARRSTVRQHPFRGNAVATADSEVMTAFEPSDSV